MPARRELSLLETNFNVIAKNLKSMVDDDISMHSVGIKEASSSKNLKCPEIPVTHFPRWATRKSNLLEDDPFGLNNTEFDTDVFVEDNNYQQNLEKEESSNLLPFTKGYINSKCNSDLLVTPKETPFEFKNVDICQTDLTLDSQSLEHEISEEKLFTEHQSNQTKNEHENTEESENFDLISNRVEECEPSALHNFYDVAIFPGKVSECVPIGLEIHEVYENIDNKYQNSSLENFNIAPIMDTSFGKGGKYKLQKLKIGPTKTFQSEQYILLNKFMKVQTHLKYLSLERLDIESNVFNILSASNSFEKTKPGRYQFNKHLTDIVQTAYKEHHSLSILFNKLERFCSLNRLGVKPVGNILLTRFKVTIDGLILMESFHTIKNDCKLDIRQFPGECIAIRNRFDNTILCIRLIRVEMWSLKQLVLNWINEPHNKKVNDDEKNIDD